MSDYVPQKAIIAAEINRSFYVWPEQKAPRDYSYGGLYRGFRLALLSMYYLVPFLWIRWYVGTRKNIERSQSRSLYEEILLFVALLFPAVVLLFECRTFAIIVPLTYVIFFIFVHMINIVFVHDQYPVVRSKERSFFLAFVKYVSVTLSFAATYFVSQPLNKEISPAQACYFSVVTSATVGYGDFFPATAFGQWLVTAQIMISVLFVIAFLVFFEFHHD